MDSDIDFEELNALAAQQTHIDCVATDETSTVKRYQRYQDEFKEYCVLVHGTTYDNPLITVDNVFNFLHYHAYRPATAKATKRKKGEPAVPKPTGFPRHFKLDVFKQYGGNLKERQPVETNLADNVDYIGYTHLNGIKSALVAMSPQEVKQQIRLDPRIKELIKHVKSRRSIQARLRKEEKVTDDLPHWELMPVIHKLEEQFWTKHSDSDNREQVAAALRDRWCYNDSFQCIIRAESLWKEELSDMLYYTHKLHGEPMDYEILVRVLWDGKTNQKSRGKALLAQCFRHLDPKRCAVGSKALYLFARFGVTEEEFDFTDNGWFEIKTAVALADRGNKKERDFTKPLGDGTYKKSLEAFQKLLGIVTGKLLHIGRKIGVIVPQLDGVDDNIITILGNWLLANGVVYQKHYCAKVPYEAMRSCAGAGKSEGRYYLPRSKIMPPEELQKMVWPGIERSRERLLAVEGNAQFVTAHRFLAAMDYLRVVVLQDAAYFMTQCPERGEHSIFTDSLFHSAEFAAYKERFAREYHHLTLPQNDPTLKHIQLVSPAIGNSLQVVVTQQKETTGKLTDIGTALAEDGERAHQERVEIYTHMMSEFRRVETDYLLPMAHDISYVANFIRGGVATSLGLSKGACSTDTAQESPCMPTENTAEQASPPQPILLAHPATVTPAQPRQIFFRCPPSNNEYDNVLEMYFDWIGSVDAANALSRLFSQTEWRKQHCPKNSAAMKRMQRMQNICNVIDKYLSTNGVLSGHNTRTSTKTIMDAVGKLEMSAFNGDVPTTFSWSRYEAAFKQYKG